MGTWWRSPRASPTTSTSAVAAPASTPPRPRSTRRASACRSAGSPYRATGDEAASSRRWCGPTSACPTSSSAISTRSSPPTAQPRPGSRRPPPGSAPPTVSRPWTSSRTTPSDAPGRHSAASPTVSTSPCRRSTAAPGTPERSTSGSGSPWRARRSTSTSPAAGTRSRATSTVPSPQPSPRPSAPFAACWTSPTSRSTRAATGPSPCTHRTAASSTPSLPPPYAAGFTPASRVFNAIVQALGRQVPERAAATGFDTTTAFTVSHLDRDTSSYQVVLEILGGGWGACAAHDGADALDNPISNCANAPVEALESDYSHFRVVEYALHEHSGGIGEHRGGLGIRRTYEAVSDGVDIAGYADRHRTGAPGLDGAGPGRPGSFTITRADGSVEQLPVVFHEKLEAA